MMENSSLIIQSLMELNVNNTLMFAGNCRLCVYDLFTMSMQKDVALKWCFYINSVDNDDF